MNNHPYAHCFLPFSISIVSVTESDANASIPICGYAKRQQRVVDGDTFWFVGIKYRLYEIDAPELPGVQSANKSTKPV
ncbi:hypothetical protein [Mesorhizobium shangrilense]|uniref:Uncharacterized protein n=1 Tax=Mesorhizobium shangrilense TaxID=460060 RepID=A0ABV2DQE8_9HYPH